MTKHGRSVLVGEASGLTALIEWLRALHVAAYGIEEGERRLQKVTVRQAVELRRSPLVLD